MTDITPSDTQARAIAAIKDWFENRTHESQVYRLFGYAGSGKSTVLKFALDELGLEPHRGDRDGGDCVPGVVTATFTGKAALVLRRKGTPARTIHSLIYSVVEATEEEIAAAQKKIEQAENEARPLSGFDRTTAEAAIEAMRQAVAGMKKPRFALNPQSDAAHARLIVLDEVSMVGEEMARDLMSFGKPILVLGDPGQLPPIRGEGAFTKDPPDIMLTEIHRQAAESAIIRLATMARQGQPIGFGQHDTFVWKMRKADVTPEQCLRGGQVICGMNATRLQLNNGMRRAAGFGDGGYLPTGKGEKIICLKNQNDLGLINGMFLMLEDIVDEGSLYFSAAVTDEDGNPIGTPAGNGARGRLRIYKGHFEDHVAFDKNRHDRDWKDKRNLTKSATGIAVSILEKQVGELRRRLNATGDVARPTIHARWANQLRIDVNGTPERNEANVITALSCDEAFAGTLVFDEFRQEIVVNRPLPWDEGDADTPRPWTDADDVRCAEWLQRREINVAPVVVSRSVGAVARDIRIHPVREYLNRLRWDGTPRLEGWTVTHLGAEDTPLNRAFGSLWMISAVARIMQPGSKADHMLILEGPQGAKKSSALAVLAGDGWFTDELAEIGSKDAALQMRGVWIIEIAELDAIGRAEVSRIKAFLSRTVDRYRPPYDRYVVDVPRQCVFAGSVNPDTYLRDETGNRRFWPVRCGRIDLDALRRDRDQLWAEAVVRYREGAIWWIDDHDLIAAANVEQEARVHPDAWHALIERWLAFEKRQVNRGYAGFDDWQTEEIERSSSIVDVSVGEILEQAIGIEPARWTRGDEMRVTAYLKANGWERFRASIGTRDDGAREWRYRLKDKKSR